MLPLLLILTLVTNATIPALAQPSVIYATEQPTNPQQGTETPSSIVLGKGTIEINGHLFTGEEFLTFLNNAKTVRIPFENASTFSLGEYDGLVGNSTVAAGGLTVLSNAIIGVFQKIAVIQVSLKTIKRQILMKRLSIQTQVLAEQQILERVLAGVLSWVRILNHQTLNILEMILERV